ncbi:hypothetical protein [Oceanisphaera ostreae]|uniref:Uncharacterized protein n=1 Tax=Oceanisphaera ostreae TaxID=914151 RepID=A0ABW3KCE1_9GAMM
MLDEFTKTTMLTIDKSIKKSMDHAINNELSNIKDMSVIKSFWANMSMQDEIPKIIIKLTIEENISSQNGPYIIGDMEDLSDLLLNKEESLLFHKLSNAYHDTPELVVGTCEWALLEAQKESDYNRKIVTERMMRCGHDEYYDHSDFGFQAAFDHLRAEYGCYGNGH